MIKNILIGLDGSAHGKVAIDAGLTLGGKLGAHVNGLHVIDVWLLRGSFLHDVNGMLGIEPQMHMEETVTTYLQSRSEAVLTRFDDARKATGIAGGCASLTGIVHEEVAGLANENDLLILGARGTSLDAGQHLAGRHLPAALLSELKVPMLVTPAQAEPPAHLGVAFDGSAGAFRALSTAAELAVQAGLRLSVIWVDSGGLEYGAADPLNKARHYLAPYGIEAAFESAKGDAREVLPRWSQKAGADILAMGSRGPSRVREMLLGLLPARLLEGEMHTALLICP